METIVSILIALFSFGVLMAVTTVLFISIVCTLIDKEDERRTSG